ncbi:serine hydrolase [Planotetraspora sp. A-T 1434]|uniref:serine hydrolase n=1 Tax=Planotetraspora sp. A-T 1434 TaxID=2979219 RepID=UPI0021BE1D6C|nr:serine hydrolase [Planotetraspora sp. A-T 1434]MCT9929103.1 serine hydrolase [Planotetraspora sp. A-T 1434]
MSVPSYASSRPARTLTVSFVASTVALSACTAAARPTTATPLKTATTTVTATPGPTSTATPTPAGEVSIPDTPVGRQLRWFLNAAATPPIPEDELAAHLSAGFLAQVPPAEFNKVIQGLGGLRLDELIDVQPTALVGLVTAGARQLKLSISVDGAEKIDGLLLTLAGPPPNSPTSWDELDRRLRAVAPQVGFLAAEVTANGRCRPVHAVAPSAPRPMGSMFKLYVLGTVADRIRAGRLSWDTPLTIRPELKSLPSGELQDRPDNSTVPLREAAQLMISISDNTGADLLIDKVGRSRVEDEVRKWSGRTKLNTPFLTTRELFLLKGADYPRLARTYLSLTREGRRDYLGKTVAKTPLSKVAPWDKPRDIGSLEWFASPNDVCRAYAGLSSLDSRPLDAVMSANDAGLNLDRKEWPTVWYKGGSEPGVLTMGFLARSAQGRTYVVTAMTADPRAALDETPAASELLSLVYGSLTLLKRAS